MRGLSRAALRPEAAALLSEKGAKGQASSLPSAARWMKPRPAARQPP